MRIGYSGRISPDYPEDTAICDGCGEEQNTLNMDFQAGVCEDCAPEDHECEPDPTRYDYLLAMSERG